MYVIFSPATTYPLFLSVLANLLAVITAPLYVFVTVNPSISLLYSSKISFSSAVYSISSPFSSYFGKSSNVYSCAGYIIAFSKVFIDLWLVILKFLIESTSSPQNSILIPVFSVTEMSNIPPLL